MTFNSSDSESMIFIWWNEMRRREGNYLTVHHVVGISTDMVNRMLILTTSTGSTFAFNLDAINYYEIVKEET